METFDVVGQVIAGKVAHILIREKTDAKIELGNLLVAEGRDGSTLILQVHNLSYGSQLDQDLLELTAGLELEGRGGSLEFFDADLRNYVLAEARAVASISGDRVTIPKALPDFFASVRHVINEDLQFMDIPGNTAYLGKVRSGSNVLDVPVRLNVQDLFTHHVLIPATTGRGKSNLVKVLLWSVVNDDNLGVLVLDPHDEYYGARGNELGLSKHPDAKEKVVYYSLAAPAGTNTLVINLKSILPWHIEELFNLTDAQTEALYTYFFPHKKDKQWIEAIFKGERPEGVGEMTASVLQRKFKTALGLDVTEHGDLICHNRAFSTTAGEATLDDMIVALEGGKIVVVDTSRLSDKAELLIGSLVINEVLTKYQRYKQETGSSGVSKLEDKPVVSIVIEEAPRVLGADVLSSRGDTTYSTVAREGRKFKIGLVAITQLTSVIPNTVLANLNTKIIFGNEMASERNAIISSAAQDLKDDYVTIGSLDKGEAIVSSIFTKFAVPIQVPRFEDFVAEYGSVNDPEDKHDIHKKHTRLVF
jgi:DNA helicase HerA-like ATPase